MAHNPHDYNRRTRKEARKAVRMLAKIDLQKKIKEKGMEVR